MPELSLKMRTTFRASLGPMLRHGGWFGFFLLLAPVIGPRGYGIFFSALSGIAIAEALVTRPVTEALVARETIDERHLSTALVTTIVAGAAMSLLLYAATGTIGAMLDEQALTDIFCSLAVLPLLGALAAIPTAVLRRRGKSAPSVAASAAGLAAGGGAAAALAWAGAGPWSLVAQIVVQRFFEAAVLWGVAGERVGITWSRRHFIELAAGLDLRALAAAWPVVTRYGPCLMLGPALGPTAVGLYMLAARLAEAVVDILLTGPVAPTTAPIVPRACRTAVLASLAAALMPLVLPPLIDLRWWGAVLPAQILLLGAIPAAVIAVRAAAVRDEADAARWQTVQMLAGIATVALLARSGLVVVASGTLGCAVLIALASLWPLRRWLSSALIRPFGATLRLLAGGFAASALLALLAGPLGLALAPVPALCLLGASGRLCYLAICG